MLNIKEKESKNFVEIVGILKELDINDCVFLDSKNLLLFMFYDK